MFWFFFCVKPCIRIFIFYTMHRFEALSFKTVKKFCDTTEQCIWKLFLSLTFFHLVLSTLVYFIYICDVFPNKLARSYFSNFSFIASLQLEIFSRNCKSFPFSPSSASRLSALTENSYNNYRKSLAIYFFHAI